MALLTGTLLTGTLLTGTLLAGVLLTGSLFAQETAPSPKEQQQQQQQQQAEAFARMSAKYQQWLRSVIGLMSQQELEHFLGLAEDYRRDAFMEAFWKPRDPRPQTAANELRDRWEQYRDAAGGFPFGDPRFLLYLLNGPPGGWTLPDGRPVARCYSRSKELEIWFYGESERTTRSFAVIFVRKAESLPYEVYLPGDQVRPLQRTGGLPTQDVRQLCAEELVGYTISEIRRVGGYSDLVKEVLAPPLPSPEWLANFSASAADLPAGAETFEIDVGLTFPHRNQSRTAVQVMLFVPREAAPGRRFGDEEGEDSVFHDFILVGEVLRDGRLFESFRYRFEGPTPDGTAVIPLGFTRYLRPGSASLKLLLEDVFGHRYARVTREIEVPNPEGLLAANLAPAPAELTAPTLRLIPPSANVLAGKVRFRASVLGEVDKVAFFLDGKQVLSKRRPPFSAELDLGEAAEPHRVRVVGYVGTSEVATDQIWLNQGTQRFRVRLIEPRSGGIYPGSVTARVQVDTPGGEAPQRLELYLNDEPVATLSEAPFAANLRLPGPRVAVIRAVAYLADGSSSEDAVVVNGAALAGGPGISSDAVEVRLVEVPVLVTDASGQGIPNLTRQSFRLFDAGAMRSFETFEEARNVPLQAAFLVDRSVSMEPYLGGVTEAVRGVLRLQEARIPEDRLAVFSFADDLSVDAALGAGPAQIDRALAGLVAHGRTAFYDGLVQAINNFGDVSGSRALILFVDGEDDASRLTYEQTLETAQRAGVTLYSVGLEATFPDKVSRRILEEFADETGGQAYFLASLEELPGVYDEILAQLGSRYLLAFSVDPASADSALGEGYRQLRVEVDAKGAGVRARRGYYP